jgi:polysaccharide biosynthesis transport protein
MNHLLVPKVGTPAVRNDLNEVPVVGRGGFGDQNGHSLSDLAKILSSHILFIVLCSVASLVCCLAFLHFRRPFYEASATLRIDPARADVLGTSNRPAAELLSQSEAIQTEAGVMKSNRVAVLALQSLTDDQFFRATRYKRESFFPLSGGVFSTQQERVLDAVSSQTIVSPQPGTQLVTIGFRNQDPQAAALMVNRLVSAYEHEGLEMRSASVTQLRSLLTSEMTALKTQLDTSQGQLADFQQAHSILGTGLQTSNGTETSSNTVIDRLRFLNDRLATAQAERIVKEGQLRAAEKGSATALAAMFSDPKLNELQGQQGTLYARYAQLSAKFGSKYPPLVDLKKQIDLVNSEVLTSANVIRERLKQDYDASEYVEQSLRDQYNSQITAAYELNRNEARYSMLQQQVTSGRELYDSLQKRLQQAVVDAEVNGVNVIVVDTTNVPTIPLGPKKSILLVSSAILGLFGGACAVLFFELTSDRIHGPRQVEHAVGYRVLGCIPRGGRARYFQLDSRSASKLVTMRELRSGTADAYRAIRNRLLIADAGESLKVLVVLSASAGEGAEIAAINTAIALAQANLRVLLVDGNLRDPSLHFGFGVSNDQGLKDALQNAELRPFWTPLQKLPTLSLVTAGRQGEGLSDEIASKSLQSVLSKWSEEFDYLIVNSAPLLQLSDSLLLAKQADGVLLVARYDNTRVTSLAQVRAMLEDIGVNVTGVLIDDVPTNSNCLTYAN